jgi:transcriptional antiterminator RfaH
MMMGKVEQEQLVGATYAPSLLVWVVVMARPAQERRAKRELENQAFEVYLPMRLYENRKGVTMATPFFPRYLFARVTLQVERWKSIYGTLGVAGVLGRPECPIGVQDWVIERIKAQEEAGFIKLAEASVLKKGERYRDVVTGLEGVFHEAVDEKRALLLTQYMGDSRMTVDIRRLKPVPAPLG